MTGANIGIVLIIILIVPVLFQLVMHENRAKKHFREILHRLELLEEKLNRAEKDNS
jgi:hypothetical protein